MRINTTIYLDQRLYRVLLAVLLFSIGVGSAKPMDLVGPYEVVMSKNDKLCSSMVNLYNQDMGSYKKLRYDRHEIFNRIKWSPVDLNEKEYCSYVRQARFDINNDGNEELVIKYSGCLRSNLTDSIFIYRSDSDILSKLKPGIGGLAPLWDTPNKVSLHNSYDLTQLSKPVEEEFLNQIRSQLPEAQKNKKLSLGIGGVFVLQPFIWESTSYISMTDLDQEWIIVAKYKQAEEMQDLCYFHGPYRQ